MLVAADKGHVITWKPTNIAGFTPPGLTDGDVLAVYEGRLDMGNKACYTPWSSAALSAYGDVFPCSNYTVGNIRRTPFMELWNNEKMVSFRRELKERKIFKSCRPFVQIIQRILEHFKIAF